MRSIFASLIFFFATTSILVAKGVARVFEDPRFEEQLKRFNKPAVHTTYSRDGDVIDCVDIYKQPAFDHPLLKNHTIQMRPSNWKIVNKDSDPQTTAYDHQYRRKNMSCPAGTVPIRRVQATDLGRFASLENYGRRHKMYYYKGGYNGVDMAGVMVEYKGPLHGATAKINVWSPSVQEDEWSHSAMEMSDGKNNFMEAGYLVYPKLFGDANPRIYTYWTSDGYHNTGCYNLLCSGFVHVSRQWALGTSINPVSVLEGSQQSSHVEVYRDKKSGNWWFWFQGEALGYWPASILSGLPDVRVVKWTGSILNLGRNKVHTTTQMGSGQMPSKDARYGKAAFFQQIEVVNDDLGRQELALSDCQVFETHPACYLVAPADKLFEWKSKHIAFFYGGSGGEMCHTYDR